MKKITMDQQARYKIMIPGELPKDWLHWEVRMEIAVTISEDVPLITTMTGKLDQAALIGVLRNLYSLGLPLLLVECIDFKNGG